MTSTESNPYAGLFVHKQRWFNRCAWPGNYTRPGDPYSTEPVSDHEQSHLSDIKKMVSGRFDTDAKVDLPEGVGRGSDGIWRTHEGGVAFEVCEGYHNTTRINGAKKILAKHSLGIAKDGALVHLSTLTPTTPESTVPLINEPKTETDFQQNVQHWSDGLARVAQRVKEARNTLTNVVDEQTTHRTYLEAAEKALQDFYAGKQAETRRKDLKKQRTIAYLESELKNKGLDDPAALALAQTLFARGLTYLEEPQITAYTVLSQALDHIVSTYWIKSEELQTYGTYDTLDLVPKSLEKYIPVRRGTSYAAVTGVCSVGAIALARASLVGTEGKVAKYVQMASTDLAVRLAAEALAATIRESQSRQQDGTTNWGYLDLSLESESVITQWNDAQQTERQHVVAMFDKALDNPLLDAEELWMLQGASGTMAHAVVFGSEAEAVAFNERIQQARPAKDYEDHSLEAELGRYYYYDLKPVRLTGTQDSYLTAAEQQAKQAEETQNSLNAQEEITAGTLNGAVDDDEDDDEDDSDDFDEDI